MKKATGRAALSRKMVQFKEKLRGAGIKITPQRLLIFRKLVQTEEHPDAETLYHQVRQSLQSISLDTVYRTLATFEKLGLASKIFFLSTRARYDPNMEHHHHFVCTSCGYVGDISLSENRDAFSNEVREIGTVKSMQIELLGTCKSCIQHHHASTENQR